MRLEASPLRKGPKVNPMALDPTTQSHPDTYPDIMDKERNGPKKVPNGYSNLASMQPRPFPKMPNAPNGMQNPVTDSNNCEDDRIKEYFKP